jgi:Tol biopolymer transport system component
MTDRWQQVEKLCLEALELEESQRAGFLKDACAGDKELRQEVESLLKFDDRGDRFIEQPALELAAKMMAHEKPESLVGQQLGSYQILSLLGAGGMGVVYKGCDIRLNRSVAIKVLPKDKMSDPERKRRFIQEARAASALNHPNIITIHDIGSEGGIDFIVMEYVAGRTLDERIPRKGMRLDEALKVAIQMADALAKASAAGIVHRDLKPRNVMVTEDGAVKVLGFGVAKLTEVLETYGESRTLESLTEERVIVGTVSYMSPEQAEGRKVDARSDIFSLGAVLYEMLSGQKAFAGDSKLSMLTAILKQEPKPIGQLVPDIPPQLGRIINRCLRKDPARRFQHTSDIKVELEELKEESDPRVLAETPPVVRPAQRSWILAGGALVIIAIAVVTWFFRGTSRKPALTPDVVPLTTYAGIEHSPSFSPDGNQVAFSWNGERQDNFDIYVKLIGSPTPLRLTTHAAEDLSPAFSPEGRSIGFLRVSEGRSLFIVIPAIGGPERIVGEVHASSLKFPARSFAWLPDGQRVVTDGLAVLSIETREIASLTSSPTKSSSDLSPAVSPDGRTVAFSRSVSFDVADIWLLDLTEDLKPKGEPRRLTSLKGFSSGSDWTPNGQEVIFTSGVFGGVMRLWKIPAADRAEPEQLPFTGGDVSWPAISRSGNRMAYQRTVRDDNIWRLSLSGPGTALGPPTRLIASTRPDAAGQYSPDGRRIAFESGSSGVRSLWVSNADGSNAEELFSGTLGSPRWSPDGQRIAFDFNGERNVDIYAIPASRGKPIRLTSDSSWDVSPTWSRDGKWVYFGSERTGRSEVWKVPAGGGDCVQVTRNGGETALESADGTSIYYTKEFRSSALWKMPVSGGEESQVLRSVHWRAFSLVNEGIYFIPDPGPDGKSSIQFLSFATGKVKRVAPISRPPTEGLSVSPDGRSLLFSQIDEEGSDLMLVENFR